MPTPLSPPLNSFSLNQGSSDILSKYIILRPREYLASGLFLDGCESECTPELIFRKMDRLVKYSSSSTRSQSQGTYFLKNYSIIQTFSTSNSSSSAISYSIKFSASLKRLVMFVNSMIRCSHSTVRLRIIAAKSASFNYKIPLQLTIISQGLHSSTFPTITSYQSHLMSSLEQSTGMRRYSMGECWCIQEQVLRRQREFKGQRNMLGWLACYRKSRFECTLFTLVKSGSTSNWQGFQSCIQVSQCPKGSLNMLRQRTLAGRLPAILMLKYVYLLSKLMNATRGALGLSGGYEKVRGMQRGCTELLRQGVNG